MNCQPLHRWLRQEIKRNTGIAVREVTAKIEVNTGTLVQDIATSTIIQKPIDHSASPLSTGINTTGVSVTTAIERRQREQ